MKILDGKNVLIVGVANKHSIAAGIAESMSENGANIALTYQNERLKGNVEKLGKEMGVETPTINTFLPLRIFIPLFYSF